ncbi:MAG TPA: Asp-tRNA(Asn)/Glu-tRNA(Gln) amidotransferase subunit GatA [Puia sp.]|nr:Asp-tRNA(Asn)/Glu-tRNA(Gln) amidotransferase subunit GatA [Puia sp.]
MFSFSSIKNYHDFLNDHPNGCVEAVNYYLSKIEEKKHLNSFLEVYADEALQKAKLLDEKRKSGKQIGKLHGIVVALKDVIAYKDHKLSASSKILENFTSIYNSTVVEKLLEEDAIIIGRNNCDEFAMGSTNENSAYGNVLNAADETRVPGGSSGGSAVAVQAGLCMVSLGSDTGGSVRQPADFCGIIGLKPTYGKISRYGLIAYASSFDQIGIFGNSIPDVALVLEVIAKTDNFDSTLSNIPLETYSPEIYKKDNKFKIAYFKEAFDHDSLDPKIKSSCYALMDELKEQGHTIEPVDFEYLDYIVPAYYVLSTAEASSNLSRFDGVKYGFRPKTPSPDLTEFYKATRSEGFGKEVKRRILLGTFVLSAGYYDAYFTKAQKIRKLLIKKTELIFNEFDLILLPTSPSTAFKIGEKTEDPIAMYLADIYTVYANLAGIPAISLPLFTHSNGMPFGIQAMTNQFKELLLLQFSHQLTQRYKSFQNPTFEN